MPGTPVAGASLKSFENFKNFCRYRNWHPIFRHQLLIIKKYFLILFAKTVTCKPSLMLIKLQEKRVATAGASYQRKREVGVRFTFNRPLWFDYFEGPHPTLCVKIHPSGRSGHDGL